MREHADEVTGFVAAAREGWIAYLADPAPTDAILAKLNPAMDARTLAEAAAAEKPLIEPGANPASIGAMARDRWSTLAAQLVDIGAIDHAPPASDYLGPATP
jgi:NitT/TauT family transport system substrate-binding protein